MSDTPETDRRIITQDPRMCGCGYKSEIVFADFARRLERERDEARFDLAFRRELYAIQEQLYTNQNHQLSEARKTILELQKP
jgi:hypothetical protein